MPQIPCPQCSESINIDEVPAHGRVACQKCGAVTKVPDAALTADPISDAFSDDSPAAAPFDDALPTAMPANAPANADAPMDFGGISDAMPAMGAGFAAPDASGFPSGAPAGDGFGGAPAGGGGFPAAPAGGGGFPAAPAGGSGFPAAPASGGGFPAATGADAAKPAAAPAANASGGKKGGLKLLAFVGLGTAAACLVGGLVFSIISNNAGGGVDLTSYEKTPAGFQRQRWMGISVALPPGSVDDEMAVPSSVDVRMVESSNTGSFFFVGVVRADDDPADPEKIKNKVRRLLKSGMIGAVAHTRGDCAGVKGRVDQSPNVPDMEVEIFKELKRMVIMGCATESQQRSRSGNSDLSGINLDAERQERQQFFESLVIGPY
ncbi:MAG: hypothetical protein AAFP90_09675 [Planctomycetota bacterium]